MSAEEIGRYTGILLSLGFSYIPKLKDWFNKLNGANKRLFMLVAMLLVIVGFALLSCYAPDLLTINPIACDMAGFKSLFTAFIWAVMANQATFLISPKKE